MAAKENNEGFIMADEVKTAPAVQAEPTFTREALAASKRYADRRDAVMLALDADREYTMTEADAAIKKLLSTTVAEEVNK